MGYPRYRRRRSGYSSQYRRPPWLVIAATIATLINAIARLFRLFGGRSRSGATTGRVEPSSRQGDPSSTQPKDGLPRGSMRDRGGAETPARETEGGVGSDGGIVRLFQQKRSDVVVAASGPVAKILPDDDDDSDGSGKHQVFLVDLLTGITVKVSHNLEFGRVPVQQGQVVSFRGKYEWTEKGGTVHWTHHDPRGMHEDGWIELEGRRYG